MAQCGLNCVSIALRKWYICAGNLMGIWSNGGSQLEQMNNWLGLCSSLQSEQIYLGINIPSEVLGALPKIFQPRGELWLWEKVLSKTKQGMLFGGRGLVSVEVVTGKVTGAVVEDGGGCNG
jgi:hypothetical protein